MLRPQTIQIFLPSGDPRGMRTAEITTRIVRVVEVPRSQLADFLKTPEAQQVGVYFLVGGLSDVGLPRAYIGQSGNVGSRLAQHNLNKDFWNRALVVISLTNCMTQTHALFLEWFAIAQATKAGRYSLENGNTGSQPYTPAPLQADCHEIHETSATLLATLGQPIFEPLTQNASANNGEPQPTELFYCKGPTKVRRRALATWPPFKAHRKNASASNWLKMVCFNCKARSMFSLETTCSPALAWQRLPCWVGQPTAGLNGKQNRDRRWMALSVK
mgnify:CR=1 FL=1